ncbi:hypothetical protein GCM10027265_32130 [Jatrophihabitans fulvus]
MLGVLGGSGGIGASSLAAVLAVAAAPSVLIDLDCAGGGLDVLLGLEHEPGARWSRLHVAGGRLDPHELVEGVPAVLGCAVLAADVAEVPAAAVAQVVSAAESLGPVVVDLPRHDTAARAAVLPTCRLVVVPVRCDVAGLVAAHAVVAGLGDVPVGVVARPGPVAPDRAARLVGGRLVGTLPAPARHGIDPRRAPRAWRTVAGGVLDAVAAA